MSKFTSILKKIGDDVLKGGEAAIQIFAFLQPLSVFLPSAIKGEVQKVGPVVADKLQLTVNAVQQAEVMGAALTGGQAGLGSQKAAVVGQQLGAMLKDIELIGGSKIGSVIKDEAAFNDAMTRAAGAFADALNACGL